MADVPLDLPLEVPLDPGPWIEDDSCACPFCGETIKNVAIKCRHCGELLGDPLSPGVFQDGKKVVVRRTAVLPPRCVKSNEPAERWLKRQLYWQSPLTYLLLLLGPVPFIIGALIVRKKA